MQSQEARRAAVPAFAGVMFASAALIFLLQPMFARMTTPQLGGSPAVWNTSMVFFQAALLLGYVYAHRLARLASLRTQVLIHGGVLAIAVLALILAGGGLTIAVSTALGQPDTERPILWLLGVLGLSVGLPYAAISATAPLLQAWYARTGRADAHDPYHLYAASNLGSLLGLAAYPIAVEPLLGLSVQAQAWAAAFVVVSIAIVGAGWLASRTDTAEAPPQDEAAPTSTWGDRLFWMAAAAAPSSLMLGVTNHISTDVASAPFLWVIPLALYLVTFVIAFGKGADTWRDPVAMMQPIALASVVIAFTENDFIFTLTASLLCFFLSALVCHLALSARRPPVGRLTEFYMWVSVGGVVGGAATALLAPVIFNDVYEYPLALAAVALFLPRRDKPLPDYAAIFVMVVAGGVALSRLLWADGDLRPFWMAGELTAQDWGQAASVLFVGLLVVAAAAEQKYARPASIGVAGLLGAAAIGRLALDQDGWAPVDYSISASMFGFAVLVLMAQRRQLVREIAAILGFGLALTVGVIYYFRQNAAPEELLFIVLAIIAVAILANRAKPVLAAALVIAAFATVHVNSADRNIAFQGRSFFGVTRVVEYADMSDGVLRVMMHGTTIHGAQYVTGERTREPMTYYHPDTGLGVTTQAGLARFPAARLGLIGLGSGSTACLKRPQDTLTIFEIDPMVVRFSTQTGVFTYTPQCAPDARVILGDARLGVQTLPDGAFDVLVVDAFSSDAVPAHLLTREAIALYLRKLSPEGIVILHLSNRNLDLVAEAARVARAGGWGALWASLEGSESADYYTSFSTSVMVIGRTQAVVDGLMLGPEWCPIVDAATDTASPFAAECGPIDLRGRAWSDEYVNLVRPLLANLGL
ncbi:MAG: fused MFS/spermidine synthase [Hyphomonadaceae bacterium]|nr:fused MFS/spermidine synthase [Hyphomonadaceae bacterium]